MAGDSRSKAGRASSLKILFALAALAVGLLLLWDYWRGQPVAAAFTRVGGPTRLETAVEASRFWLTPPQSVVTSRANASQEIMWGAARCAMVHDAPLLFTSRDRRGQQLVHGTMRDLGKAATAEGSAPPKEIPVLHTHDVTACLRHGDLADLKGFSTLAASDLPPDFPKVESRTKLAAVAVFAAAKTSTDSPDVAVALALAAHMANPHREVSLVVVPRYLEADPELEAQLRARRELVKSGVVLGQTGVLSEDTRLLLRQVLTSTDRRGFLGEIRTDLGPLEVLLAALLAAVGGAAAARVVAPELAQVVGRIPGTTRRYIVAGPRFTRNGRQTNPAEAAWVEALEKLPQPSLGDRKVTVVLRSGRTVRGNVERRADHADVSSETLLQLNGAEVNGKEPESVQIADFVLVRFEDIELISVEIAKAGAGAGASTESGA